MTNRSVHMSNRSAKMTNKSVHMRNRSGQMTNRGVHMRNRSAQMNRSVHLSNSTPHRHGMKVCQMQSSKFCTLPGPPVRLRSSGMFLPIPYQDLRPIHLEPSIIILPSTPTSLTFKFQDHKFVYVFHHAQACYTCHTKILSFHYSNYPK